MAEIKLINGDCLVEMPNICDNSIDLILCDLPYGILAHKWDSIIPMDRLWSEYNRIIKDDGVIALFAREPFTSRLICSNIDDYRYSWIWVKESPTGFLNSAYRPLQLTEDIAIFSKAKVGSNSKNKIRYNPQGVVEVNASRRNNPNNSWREQFGYNQKNNVLNSDKEYTQKYTNHPTNVIKFSRDKDALHPTQKPVALLEYLINTYTNEGDIVLDNCMGSGSTMVACVNTNRNGIGIELDDKYFMIAKQRLNYE